MSEKTYRASAIIDAPVKDCWNLIDSYGEICVHCGCCSKDPLTRYNARIEVLLQRIEHCVTFDEWSADSSLRATQEENVAKDLRQCRAQLRYYKKRLKELKNGTHCTVCNRN